MKIEHTHEGLMSESARAFYMTIPERKKFNSECFDIAHTKQVVIKGQLVEVKVYKKKETVDND